MRGSRKLFLGSPRKNCVCREKGGSEAYFREFYYMNQKRFNFQGGGGPTPDPNHPLDPRMLRLLV